MSTAKSQYPSVSAQMLAKSGDLFIVLLTAGISHKSAPQLLQIVSKFGPANPVFSPAASAPRQDFSKPRSMIPQQQSVSSLSHIWFSFCSWEGRGRRSGMAGRPFASMHESRSEHEAKHSVALLPRLNLAGCGHVL
jgi:hypothetical protein